LLLPFFLLAITELCLRLAGYGYNPHFFKSIPIDGKDFLVQNEQFSFRFFPKSMARSPGPLRFPASKSPGTFRIFILGESAAMGDPAESFAPDRYLELMLRQKYPDRNFEIINTSVTAIDSHVILPIARECATQQGDLWIVYMGNNEMVGPYGAATVFGWRAPALPLARFAVALQKLRVGQWCTDTGRKLAKSKSGDAAWGGMEMFLNNQVPPESPMRETVYKSFQQNLDDIVGAGIHSGATVLLNTVGVNLRDCPPFGSLPGHTLAADEQAKFESLHTNALQSAGQQQWVTAQNYFEQASQLDDKRAEFQYQWAECLLAQTNFSEAKAHFQFACDYDALPFRADSRINATIRNEPRRIKSDRLIICDAAQALAGGSPSGICGDETFFEHVHFDFDARYRLARAWAEQIESMFPHTTNRWLSQEECEQQLGLSPWNRSQVIHLMVERMQMPPLSNQANNKERRGVLEKRIKSELTQMNHEQADRTRTNFEQRVKQRPNDFFLHENFAVFLELSGDLSAATEQWKSFRDLLPQDPLGYFEAGRLLVSLQRYAEAETLLRQTLAIRPSRTDGWTELGNALALQQKYAEALNCFGTALKQDSHDPQIYLKRGKVLARLNRHEEAMASYRMGLALNPAGGLTHHELGLELIAAGQVDAAGPEFREAAQFSPDNVAIRFDYGTWLLRKQLWPEAQREFESVLQLEPGNARAEKQLLWLQSKVAGKH
jgi:tetratricopeptide (TPR) repeat protein